MTREGKRKTETETKGRRTYQPPGPWGDVPSGDTRVIAA